MFRSFAVFLMWLAFQSAFAQGFPVRAVRLVVPFPPGGSTDIVARLVADQLSRTWGQPVVVDNRSGASGQIGADAVAKAAPDGYTMLMGTLATNVIGHLLFSKIPYGPDAFAPVTMLATTPNMLLVNASIPVSTVAELVAYAKARPGVVSYSSAGVGLSSHLGMELFTMAAGIELLHVPYRGSSPAHQAFVAKQVNLHLTLVPNAVFSVKAGEAKPLAVASAKRAPQFPDVPTFAEVGYKGVEAYAWNGLMVPAGTARAVIDKIQRDAMTALKNPELRKRLNSLGLDPIGGTPEDFATAIRQEYERWGPLIKRGNIRVE